MTQLYLIRHGIAADPKEYDRDRDRPLTEEGKRKTRKVATKLAELNLHFDLILTSPLLRATQTADILKTSGLSDRIEEFPALAFDGKIETWLSWWQAWQKTDVKSLALVGHQPNLGNWADILVWGEVRGNLVVKKAGVIGITLPTSDSPVGCSQLFWLTSPKLTFVE